MELQSRMIDTVEAGAICHVHPHTIAALCRTGVFKKVEKYRKKVRDFWLVDEYEVRLYFGCVCGMVREQIGPNS